MTVSIDDDLAERLRRAAEALYGSRRRVSRVVEDALRSYLASLEIEENVRYLAVKGGETLAEAKTLSELAAKLRELGVDTRGVRIVRSGSPKSPARGGYRLKPAAE